MLVLGTMPGVVSLQLQQYYAHPENQFWRLVFAAFSKTDPGAYPERIVFLLSRRIALWDGLHSCDREGSLDARIAVGTERPNDIRGFLEQHTGVRAIALNGGKANRYFQRFVLPGLVGLHRDLHIMSLPSTSPAHTIPFADKLSRWMEAFDRADLREVSNATRSGSDP